MMPHLLAMLIEIITSVLTISGIAYYLVAMMAGRSFAQSGRGATQGAALSVSILKPLKGLDPAMMEGLRSHCQQTFAGRYEIIFGVGSQDDPATRAVEQLKAEFPDRKIELVICPERLGANGKVSALMQMLPTASHDILLVNDSDIRVTPRYLEDVTAEFARESSRKVGLVTALYRGRPHKTLPSHLESLGIATDFQAGVLVSRWMERGLHFGLGSTLAIRREALAAIGGFGSLVDHLADDYELGARVHAAGYGVALAAEVVETNVPAYGWGEFMNHQLRWARTVRDARPGGYIGLVATHGLAWGMLNVLASGGSGLSIWLFSLVFFLRLAMAMSIGVGVLKDHEVLPDLWLLPLRDLIHLGVWWGGFAGNSVVWRDERFTLHRGRLSQP